MLFKKNGFEKLSKPLNRYLTISIRPVVQASQRCHDNGILSSRISCQWGQPDVSDDITTVPTRMDLKSVIVHQVKMCSLARPYRSTKTMSARVPPHLGVLTSHGLTVCPCQSLSRFCWRLLMEIGNNVGCSSPATRENTNPARECTS